MIMSRYVISPCSRKCQKFIASRKCVKTIRNLFHRRKQNFTTETTALLISKTPKLLQNEIYHKTQLTEQMPTSTWLSSNVIREIHHRGTIRGVGVWFWSCSEHGRWWVTKGMQRLGPGPVRPAGVPASTRVPRLIIRDSAGSEGRGEGYWCCRGDLPTSHSFRGIERRFGMH